MFGAGGIGGRGCCSSQNTSKFRSGGLLDSSTRKSLCSPLTGPENFAQKGGCRVDAGDLEERWGTSDSQARPRRIKCNEAFVRLVFRAQGLR